MKKVLIAIMLSLINIACISAQEISIQLKTDREDVTTNEIINFSISAKGIDIVDIKNVSGIENFDILGSSQSSSISIINGNMDSNFIFNFRLKPKKDGKITLGPLKINKDGKDFISNSLSINIEKGRDNIFLNPTNTPDYRIKKDEELNEGFDQVIQNNSNDENDFDYTKIVLVTIFIFIVIAIIIIRKGFGSNLNEKNKNPNNNFLESSSDLDLNNFHNEDDIVGKLLSSIQEKYSIDIHGKTYGELIELVSLKDSIKGTMLKEIFDLVNESKYSKNQISTLALSELVESFLLK